LRFHPAAPPCAGEHGIFPEPPAERAHQRLWSDGRPAISAGPDGPAYGPSYNRTRRHVTLTMRRTVFRWYGIAYANHARYEVDHLEPRFACGADDVRNLWPEPGPSPNVKDKDESRWYSAFRQSRHTVKQVQRHFLRWSR
jgi:hypothetical protein